MNIFLDDLIDGSLFYSIALMLLLMILDIFHLISFRVLDFVINLSVALGTLILSYFAYQTINTENRIRKEQKPILDVVVRYRRMGFINIFVYNRGKHIAKNVVCSFVKKAESGHYEKFPLFLRMGQQFLEMFHKSVANQTNMEMLTLSTEEKTFIKDIPVGAYAVYDLLTRDGGIDKYKIMSPELAHGFQDELLFEDLTQDFCFQIDADLMDHAIQYKLQGKVVNAAFMSKNKAQYTNLEIERYPIKK